MMTNNHTHVGRPVHLIDGDGHGVIESIDLHVMTGQVVGAVVKLDEPFTPPVPGAAAVTHVTVFWSRLELV
jgi:hypothetical protein